LQQEKNFIELFSLNYSYLRKLATYCTKLHRPATKNFPSTRKHARHWVLQFCTFQNARRCWLCRQQHWRAKFTNSCGVSISTINPKYTQSFATATWHIPKNFPLGVSITQVALLTEPTLLSRDVWTSLPLTFKQSICSE